MSQLQHAFDNMGLSQCCPMKLLSHPRLWIWLDVRGVRDVHKQKALKNVHEVSTMCTGLVSILTSLSFNATLVLSLLGRMLFKNNNTYQYTYIYIYTSIILIYLQQLRKSATYLSQTWTVQKLLFESHPCHNGRRLWDAEAPGVILGQYIHIKILRGKNTVTYHSTVPSCDKDVMMMVLFSNAADGYFIDWRCWRWALHACHTHRMRKRGAEGWQ